MNPMKQTRPGVDAREISRRAAAIRKNWSTSEKERRTGLPPDVPVRLRQYILGYPKLDWPVVMQTAR